MNKYQVEIQMERNVEFVNGKTQVLPTDCKKVDYEGFSKEAILAMMDSFSAGCILVNENTTAMKFKNVEVTDMESGEIIYLMNFEK